MDPTFASRLETHARAVEARLAAALDGATRPERLVAAMRHAVLGGGKRLRPYLVLEGAALFGANGPGALAAAASVEALHAYSLVHDDLPSMDDDDLRRGLPTVHRAFDEATAILAGDALQTLAFALLCDRKALPRAGTRARLIESLARASGLDGMVGGQMRDLAAEGRFDPAGRRRRLGLAGIRRLQAGKTGALIAHSAEAGAIVAGAAAPERRALRRYGEKLGLAFQIRDDLLDHEGDAATLGKAVAKDAARGKATFVSLLGAGGARNLLNEAQREARNSVAECFGTKAAPLVDLLEFNASRRA